MLKFQLKTYLFPFPDYFQSVFHKMIYDPQRKLKRKFLMSFPQSHELAQQNYGALICLTKATKTQFWILFQIHFKLLEWSLKI
jgi:hypothetical protein